MLITIAKAIVISTTNDVVISTTKAVIINTTTISTKITAVYSFLLFIHIFTQSESPRQGGDGGGELLSDGRQEPLRRHL